ncbi:hypothetical protein TrispH2_007207 [Trichoplax sp. H2]|nr:hypothetical protein TrispH2_007207 [Trichoplax sp. H2]|eukprot:RDD40300.1 hypothetical protein TrispH2_007207 [Trichoplax sp. H2]
MSTHDSYCTVERKADEDWLRSQKRHYGDQSKSNAFKSETQKFREVEHTKQKMDVEMKNKERRHFQSQNKSHLTFLSKS